MSYSNSIIIIILGVIALVGVKKQDSDQTLSIEQSMCIKGMAAIILVLVHIKNALVYPGIYSVFSSTGFLFVAIFFFYSGYGIALKTYADEKYIRNKLPKKIIDLVLMVVSTEIIYLIADVLLFHKTYTISQTVCALLGVNLLNGAMWYIIALLIIYTTTVCFNHMWKSGGVLSLSVVSVMMYVAISIIRGRAPHELQSCVAYLLGVKYAQRKSESNYVNINGGIVCVVGIVSFVAPYIVRHFWYDYFFVRVICGSICSIAFIEILLYVLSRIAFKNSVLLFIGKISTEIYLSHQLIIRILSFYFPGWFSTNNSILLTIVILLVTVIVSKLIAKIRRMIKEKKKRS